MSSVTSRGVRAGGPSAATPPGRGRGAASSGSARPTASAGYRPPLTKDLLYAQALAIVDAEGLDALTMRRLAADLGVEAASLYHHVPNKQALLDGVLGLVRAEMTFEEPLPTDWRELLEVVFMRYLEVLGGHPHLLPLAGRHVEGEPAEGLQYLVSQGFDDDEACELWQSIIAFVVGFAVFASRQFPEDTDYLPPALARRMERWDSATARRTLRAILRSYHPSRPPDREGNPG